MAVKIELEKSEIGNINTLFKRVKELWELWIYKGNQKKKNEAAQKLLNQWKFITALQLDEFFKKLNDEIKK